MKIINLLAAGAALAKAYVVRSNATFDDPTRSMWNTFCSNSDYGLITRFGWETQGAIPSFPNIAGSSIVRSWNSGNCGMCVMITYNNKSVAVLVMDHSPVDMALSKHTWDILTGGLNTSLEIQADLAYHSYDACNISV